jgi:hypothetical protein
MSCVHRSIEDELRAGFADLRPEYKRIIGVFART